MKWDFSNYTYRPYIWMYADADHTDYTVFQSDDGTQYREVKACPLEKDLERLLNKDSSGRYINKI